MKTLTKRRGAKEPESVFRLYPRRQEMLKGCIPGKEKKNLHTRRVWVQKQKKGGGGFSPSLWKTHP